jgi:hypothetical protein
MEIYASHFPNLARCCACVVLHESGHDQQHRRRRTIEVVEFLAIEVIRD